MAIDAFLYFPGQSKVVGETLDSDMASHKAFELETFGFGAENEIIISSDTGGAGGGKTDFNPFTLNKKTDTASCGLFAILCTSKHFKEAILELRRSGGSDSKSGATFMKFHFKMVVVKSMTWNGDGDSVTEDLEFQYGAIKIEYFQQKSDGTFKKADKDQGEVKWSRTLNKADYRVE